MKKLWKNRNFRLFFVFIPTYWLVVIPIMMVYGMDFGLIRSILMGIYVGTLLMTILNPIPRNIHHE